MAIDQRQLNPELSQALEPRQGELKIVKTTKTPSGQILDWVPIDSQLPEGKIASPPSASYLAESVEDKLKPVKAASFELDDPAVERGPEGTVPIVRPDLTPLTKTIAVKDYLNKRGSFAVNKNRHNKNPTDPNPFGYFHAIDSQSTKLYGCDGFLNVWDPSINNPTGAWGRPFHHANLAAELRQAADPID